MKITSLRPDSDTDTEQCPLHILMIMHNGRQSLNTWLSTAIRLNFRADIDPVMATKAISRDCYLLVYHTKF